MKKIFFALVILIIINNNLIFSSEVNEEDVAQINEKNKNLLSNISKACLIWGVSQLFANTFTCIVENIVFPSVVMNLYDRNDETKNYLVGIMAVSWIPIIGPIIDFSLYNYLSGRNSLLPAEYHTLEGFLIFMNWEHLAGQITGIVGLVISLIVYKLTKKINKFSVNLFFNQRSIGSSFNLNFGIKI